MTAKCLFHLCPSFHHCEMPGKEHFTESSRDPQDVNNYIQQARGFNKVYWLWCLPAAYCIQTSIDLTGWLEIDNH